MLTLAVCLLTDVLFVFVMLIGMNGFSGKTAEIAFGIYIIGVLFKSLIVSLLSSALIVYVSRKHFPNSFIASIFLVLLAVIVFSTVNLAIDFLGAFVVLGIAESSRPRGV